MRSDPVSEDYQAEVDASTARLEKRYAKAQRALAAAEAKAERAQQYAVSCAQRREVACLNDQVAKRRQELRAIELLMMPSTYAGRDHRKRTARHVSS